MSRGLAVLVALNQAGASAALLGAALAGLCWAHAHRTARRAFANAPARPDGKVSSPMRRARIAATRDAEQGAQALAFVR
jgi:hypothetical protein